MAYTVVLMEKDIEEVFSAIIDAILLTQRGLINARHSHVAPSHVLRGRWSR